MAKKKEMKLESSIFIPKDDQTERKYVSAPETPNSPTKEVEENKGFTDKSEVVWEKEKVLIDHDDKDYEFE